MGLERINTLRKAKGMTIDELSEKAAVPLSTLKKICAGSTVNPALETVKSIARALDCTIDEFDDITKAPAEQERSGGVSIGESTQFLIELGYIREGEVLSDADFDFLVHVMGLLDAWFSKKA